MCCQHILIEAPFIITYELNNYYDLTTVIIAQLGAYGFHRMDAHQHMRSHVANRKQRVRVNSNLRTWENIPEFLKVQY